MDSISLMIAFVSAILTVALLIVSRNVRYYKRRLGRPKSWRRLRGMWRIDREVEGDWRVFSERSNEGPFYVIPPSNEYFMERGIFKPDVLEDRVFEIKKEWDSRGKCRLTFKFVAPTDNLSYVPSDPMHH